MALSHRTDFRLTLTRLELESALKALRDVGVLPAEPNNGSIAIVGPNTPLPACARATVHRQSPPEPADSVDWVWHVSQSELDQSLGALCALGFLKKEHLQSRSLAMLAPPAVTAPLASPNAEIIEVVEPSGPPAPKSACCGVSCSTVTHRCCEIAAQRRFYAVICGLDVGVFEGWDVVQPLLFDKGENGKVDKTFPYARSHVFSSREEAQTRFDDAQLAGEVMKLSK